MKNMTFQLAGRLCSIALLFALGGCGGSVDFLPEFKRLPTTPDPFTFTTQTGVATGVEIPSNSITVTGLTADAQISVSGTVGSNSKYSINGATATNVAGTVKKDDKVTVTQTSSTALGATSISTLTIGNVNGTFTITTQLVEKPSFTLPAISANGLAQSFATIHSLDGVPGTHVISIKDHDNTGRAAFAVGDVNGNVATTFFSVQQTIPTLNGLRIFVRNLSSTTNVTTLTIDTVGTEVILTAP